MTTREELREKLAAIEHEQWASWTSHMLSVLKEPIGLGFYEARDNDLDTPGLQKAEEGLERWSRQINTPYADLSEKEKDSDREWADKVLALVQPNRPSRTTAGTVRVPNDELAESLERSAREIRQGVRIAMVNAPPGGDRADVRAAIAAADRQADDLVEAALRLRELDEGEG